jgi:Ca2+/Na+ antiporter
MMSDWSTDFLVWAMEPGRRLSLTMQEISECRLQADLFDLEMSGFVAVELGIFLYAIVVMHVLIDEYYVPALELVTSPEVLDLPRPLLGVTIMAAGNCLPELSMSLVALLWSGSQDIGTGEVFGSCVFDLLAILGVVCIRLPPEAEQASSAPLAKPLMLYFIAWTAIATATDASLFYSDVDTTWPASMTMVALYVAFVCGAFLCHRLIPGFVGDDPTAQGLPTHALVHTPDSKLAAAAYGSALPAGGGALVASGERAHAVGGYRGGGPLRELGSGACSAATSGYHSGGYSSGYYSDYSYSSASPCVAREVAALSAAGALSEEEVDEANRALATLIAHGGSTSALHAPPSAGHLAQGHGPRASPPPSPPTPVATTGGGVSSALAPTEAARRVHAPPRAQEHTPLLLSPPAVSVPGEPHSPNPSPPDAARGGGGAVEGGGGGDGDGRASHSLAVRGFEAVAAPARWFFRMTVPEATTPSLLLGGRRPWGLTIAICIVYTLLLSYAMVAVASRAICLLGMRKNSLGASVLCLSAGFPDLLTAMILVKRPGMLGMAAANPFGAFLFNALVALGLPWLILGTYTDVFPPASGTWYPSLIGFVAIFAGLLLLLQQRLRLSRRLGVALLGLYAAYLIAIIRDGALRPARPPA